MKKYKIDNYLVEANSPIEAMKAVQTLKDSGYYWNDIREMCIRNNWYTYGTNREYNNLFDKAVHGQWKAEQIAQDIATHSSPDVRYEDVLREVKRLHVYDSVKDSFSPNQMVTYKPDGDALMRVKIVKKLTEAEKKAQAGKINPNAGDYYEVEHSSTALGTSRWIVWEGRLKDSKVKDSIYEMTVRGPKGRLTWYIEATSENEALSKINQQPGHRGSQLVKSKIISRSEAERVGAYIIDSIKDEAFDRSTIEALISDEKAAIDAYNVAIANLNGKISDLAIKVLQAIRDDELRHSENLNAILAGNVTEKNLEDSVNDADPKQTIATIVAMLDDAKSAIQSEQYQRCGNLCFNIIQKLKATGLAK